MISWIRWQWFRFKQWLGITELSPAAQRFGQIAKKHGFEERK